MTQMLNNRDLAAKIGVTPGRISQYVSAGKLAGCYSGDGTSRRFDLVKVCAALGRTLDPGQMMGNGAETRQVIRSILADVPEEAPAKPAAPVQRDGAELLPTDAARYELARTQKAEEEARRLRRINQEAEGTLVLASEVSHLTAKLIAQEIAEVEAVLRDGARHVADRLGVDFKTVRQILVETWRGHRAKRSDQLEAQAVAASMSEAEVEGDL